jgi:hypothetical protein
MIRILASLSLGLLLAVPAAAQTCATFGPTGTLIGNGDDTTFAAHYPLGFTYTMPGSANTTYTHFRLNPNGWMILTDGVATPTGIPTGYGSSTTLAGATAGYSPRIAPFWRDLTVTAPGGVYYDNTTNPGVSCKVTWFEARDYNVLPVKSISAELFATGDIIFSYSDGLDVNQTSPVYVGVSPGNGQVPPAASDLTIPGASGGVGMVWESFPRHGFTLSGATGGTFLLQQDGSGGWNWAPLCGGGGLLYASHEVLGTGCYAVSGAHDTFYQQWLQPTAAADSSAALTGNSMTLTPTLDGYVATWNAGGATAYVAPGTAASSTGVVSLPTTDDGQLAITPTAGLTNPFGAAATTLTVQHNGIISLGGTAPTGFSPTGALVASHTQHSFYIWGDWNDTEAGSGTIKTEEGTYSGNQILFVTWDNVESYQSPAVVSPSTFQFQFNLTTGEVTYVWVSMDTIGYNLRNIVVGYTPAGVSQDPGSIDLATAGAVVTFPDTPAILPMTLSASPAPVFTLGGSSVPMTWSANNVPELIPGSGFRACLLAFSLVGIPSGIDLGSFPADIGAPGCSAYIGSLDVIFDGSGLVGNPITWPLTFPQPLSPGDTFYSQAISLLPPGTPATGSNTFGLRVSNGVKSVFHLQ